MAQLVGKSRLNRSKVYIFLHETHSSCHSRHCATFPDRRHFIFQHRYLPTQTQTLHSFIWSRVQLMLPPTSWYSFCFSRTILTDLPVDQPLRTGGDAGGYSTLTGSGQISQFYFFPDKNSGQSRPGVRILPKDRSLVPFQVLQDVPAMVRWD